jgi:flavodoxin I
MRVTVIYGTDNGATHTVAEQIAAQIEGKVVEICSAEKADFEDCDLLILGTPTCGYGDLQSDWDSRLKILSQVNLDGRKVALFGLGDQITYADTFVDGMGVLYEELMVRRAEVIGSTSVEDYDFYSSRAVREESFVGLVLDEDTQPHKTEERITSWIASLKSIASGGVDAQQTPRPQYAA